MVIVSDYLQHDKYAVNVFLRAILQFLDANVRHFEKVVFFSDGPSSQFKQRFLLSSITLFNRNIVWNFFATSHGKGPVDGIGGSTTRLVSSEVMSGKAEVTTSTEFAEVAAKKCQNIQIKHICKAEVQSEIKKLDDDWNEITAIPNTKQVHRVTVVAPFIIDVQHHASSPSTRHHFKGENADGGEDGEHIDEDHDVEAVSSDVVANPKNMPETLPEDLNLKWVVARYSDQRNLLARFLKHRTTKSSSSSSKRWNLGSLCGLTLTI